MKWEVKDLVGIRRGLFQGVMTAFAKKDSIKPSISHYSIADKAVNFRSGFLASFWAWYLLHVTVIYNDITVAI
jgi:hypothetical protein